jgi:hypothetical protein
MILDGRGILEDDIDRLEEENEALLAEVERLEGLLVHIAEYWNRHENERAMVDALWHIIEVAEGAALKEQSD